MYKTNLKQLTYMREWRKQHHQEDLESKRRWRHSQSGREWIRNYRIKLKHDARYQEYLRDYRRERRHSISAQMFAILGYKCAICGFADRRALQIDHIDGGGTAERHNFQSSHLMYSYYLRHREEAKEKLQVLCANCNWIKRVENQEYTKPITSYDKRLKL